LADLARLAGTTVPTVSKVLNGRTDVSASTRHAVMSAVESSGYQRSRSRLVAAPRGALADPTLGLVDLVLNAVEGTWANSALSGVEEAAAEAGLDVVVTLARGDGRHGGDWVTRLLGRRSRGAVLALVSPTRPQLSTLAAAGVPVVLLDPRAAPDPALSSVGTTNWSGGRAAAEHLLSLGHRRLAVIGGRGKDLFSQARIDGFRSALQDFDLVAEELPVRFADWGMEAAQVRAGELLDGPDAPTAIFACSDWMALGVLRAARERNREVPGEVSVIGFDDLPEAQWVSPSLTTIRQPIRLMGAAALRMLLQLQRAAEPVPYRQELATVLVERESTGPAPV
jgi:DNA-binding LacI/PurR family transcriptional regulator